MIGMLWWIVGLERVDIICEILMMVSMMAMPRKGHLIQVYHIFVYLKRKHNAEIVFDPANPQIDDDVFPKYNWSHTLYCNSMKVIHENAPKSKGMGFKIITFVNSDHAGDTIPRSHELDFWLNSTVQQFTSFPKSNPDSKHLRLVLISGQ